MARITLPYSRLCLLRQQWPIILKKVTGFMKLIHSRYFYVIQYKIQKEEHIFLMNLILYENTLTLDMGGKN